MCEAVGTRSFEPLETLGWFENYDWNASLEGKKVLSMKLFLRIICKRDCLVCKCKMLEHLILESVYWYLIVPESHHSWMNFCCCWVRQHKENQNIRDRMSPLASTTIVEPHCVQQFFLASWIQHVVFLCTSNARLGVCYRRHGGNCATKDGLINDSTRLVRFNSNPKKSGGHPTTWTAHACQVSWGLLAGSGNLQPHQ